MHLHSNIYIQKNKDNKSWTNKGQDSNIHKYKYTYNIYKYVSNISNKTLFHHNDFQTVISYTVTLKKVT